jgi:hypothetical protein
MEILRLPSVQPEAIIDVDSPNTEYSYSVLDLSAASSTTGAATSGSTSKVAIPLSPLYDSDYKITVDGEEHFVTVVRPYVDPRTLGSNAAEITEATKNEEIARAIIDAVIDEGFYYKKRVIDMIGQGADYLPMWLNVQKLLKIRENNLITFDSENPGDYEIIYGLTDDKTAITILYDEQINRAEGANIELPMAPSDLWDTKFGYRGFPKGFDYTISLEVGYKKVPSNVQRAATLLIEDIKCNGLEYIGKYVSEYSTDQFKIKFDDRVFEGTGNMIVDKILAKYSKTIRKVGVL